MANSKTLLKTYCQERHFQLPVYSTEKGDGSSGFTSSVRVCERNYESQAIHPSAQLAEEDAARVAYKNLKQSVTDQISKPAPEVYSRSTGYGYEPLDTTSRATRTPAVASRSCSAQSACTGLVTNGTNTNATADYSQKLEKLCNAHGLPTPQYVVKESSDAAGNFAATAIVGKGEYLSGTSDSYVEAKEYAALVALAEVGLSLLNIKEKEDGREENLEKNKQAFRSNDHSPPPVSRTRAHNDYELPEKNYKAMVNEYCQKHNLPLPEYETDYASDSIGFVSVLNACDKEYQSDSKSTKKKAEQNAAGKAALDIGLVKMDELEARIGSPSLGTSRIGSQSLVNGSVCSSGEVKSSFSSGFSAGTADTSVAEPITSNYKGVLQEFLAKRGLGNPTYSTVQSCSRLFVSTISLKDLSGKPTQLQGKGYSTKKNAEQSAAKQACIYYELVN